MIFYMTVGIGVMLLFAVSFVLFFLLSQRKLHQEQQKIQEQNLLHQEQLLYSTIQTQEEERKRIAKDLHDDIGSKLNVIHLGLHRLQKHTVENPEHALTIKEVSEVLQDTIGATRRIAHDLLPPTLENFGLKEAIRELCDKYSRTGAVNAHFEVFRQSERPCDKKAEVNLFRVIQELTSNSIRHGKAENILISMWITDTEIRIEFTDDGLGFDPDLVPQGKGLGTQSMLSRLKMIGASMYYDTAPNAGYKAFIQYPFLSSAAL
jgi:signal transduction histidine kinase